MDVSSCYSIHCSFVPFLLGKYYPCHVRIYLLSRFPVPFSNPNPSNIYVRTVYRSSLLYLGDKLHPPSLLTVDRISVVNTSVFTGHRSKINSMFLYILFNSSLSKCLLLACTVFCVGPSQKLSSILVSTSAVYSALSTVLHQLCCALSIRHTKLY